MIMIIAIAQLFAQFQTHRNNKIHPKIESNFQLRFFCDMSRICGNFYASGCHRSFPEKIFEQLRKYFWFHAHLICIVYNLPSGVFALHR